MIRLLLVDQKEIDRRGVLENLGSAVDGNGVDNIDPVPLPFAVNDLHDVDIALLNTGRRGESDVYLCRELKTNRPHLACLLMTSYPNDEALEAAVLAGANGFALRELSSNELIQALHRVARGESLLSEDMVETTRARLARRSEDEERLAGLSPQELRILHLLSKGRTNREISEETFLAESTVKNYLAQLLRKLGYARRAEAALFAQRHESSSGVVNASEN